MEQLASGMVEDALDEELQLGRIGCIVGKVEDLSARRADTLGVVKPHASPGVPGAPSPSTSDVE